MDKPKLGNLIAAKSALDSLAASKLKGTVAYLVAKNINLVNQELQNFDVGRKAIMFRHSIQDGQTNIPVAAKAEFDELLGTEVQAEFVPIAPADLPEISPEDVMKMMWLICAD